MQELEIKTLLKNDHARIRWVNYGVANTFSYNFKNKSYKIIEINKELIDEPKLFYPILFHELRHSKKIFSKEDVINDFSMANLRSLPNLKILGFMFTHPKALLQICPFYKTKKQGWVFDLNLCVVYLIAIIIAIFLIVKF